MGLIGAIGSLITAHHQKKLAAAIHPVNANYQASPEIQQLYGAGTNLYQGRMAGAGTAENNILTSGADTRSAVERNATSGSQALAVAAGVQGQENQSFQDLAAKEAQDKVSRFGVYSNVSQLMANEGDKVFQDKLRNYYDDLNYKRGLQGAAMQNRQAGLNSIDSTIGSVLGYGMNNARNLTGG